ncbi:hypothetical protein B6D60_01055 [candidate division KSB1 bacterium 4484_87]|nr:MAG: hypothetical protein B6D60_01055 [candidate division KSB1 bacterium 4484_87]
MKKIALFVTLLLLPLALLAEEKATQSGQKTFPIETGASIYVSNDEGNIEVNSWDKSEVQIAWEKIAFGKSKEAAEKILKETEIDIFHSVHTLRVKIIEPRREKKFSFWDIFDPDTWANFPRSPVVHFRLFVPRNADLNLSADEGNISVKNCSGSLTITVDEGKINCENIVGEDIKLVSDEGRITGTNIQAPDGKIFIRTDEGKIHLENAACDRATIKCDEGKIYCSEFYARRATMTTDEGNIEVFLANKDGDSYRFYTDEGNVTLHFPDAFSCKFDLKTQEGRIRDDFGLKISKFDGGQRCRESIGTEPARQITVSVSEGNIYLRKK